MDVAPSMPREVLAAMMAGEMDGGTQVNEIDKWRHGLTGFVFDHWKVLEPQITCPIKSKDPKSCWGCTDAQVIACVISNAQNEHLIRLHRK